MTKLLIDLTELAQKIKFIKNPNGVCLWFDFGNNLSFILFVCLFVIVAFLNISAVFITHRAVRLLSDYATWQCTFLYKRKHTDKSYGRPVPFALVLVLLLIISDLTKMALLFFETPISLIFMHFIQVLIPFSFVLAVNFLLFVVFVFHETIYSVFPILLLGNAIRTHEHLLIFTSTSINNSLFW